MATAIITALSTSEFIRRGIVGLYEYSECRARHVAREYAERQREGERGKKTY